MAITLPADLEINAFVGEGEEGCFHIKLCCLLSGSKKSVSMSHHMYLFDSESFRSRHCNVDSIHGTF